MKSLILAICLALCVGLFAMGSGGYYSTKQLTYAKHVITNGGVAGDTAKVVTVGTFGYYDSTEYACSVFTDIGLSGSNDTTRDTSVYSYFSPPKTIRITPTTIVDSGYYACSLEVASVGIDVVAWTSRAFSQKIVPIAVSGGSYSFSVGFLGAGDVFTVAFTNGTSGTVAEVCDSIVAVGNALAVLTDSVLFIDSTTFVHIATLGSSDGAIGNVVSHFHITSTPVSYATITNMGTNVNLAMICDSMVATWNAEADYGDTTIAVDYSTYWTVSDFQSSAGKSAAWNVWEVDEIDTAQTVDTITVATKYTVNAGIVASFSGNAEQSVAPDASDTTTYIMTANIAGRMFYMLITDTAQDTTVTTANAGGKNSTHTDEFYVTMPADGGFRTLLGKGVLRDGLDAGSGNHTDDSAIVWLYAIKAGDRMLIGSTIIASPPGSLIFRVPEATGDTLLGDALLFKVWTQDTLSDSSGTILYPFEYEYILK